MKLLWKFGISALLFACIVSDGKAIVNGKQCLEPANGEGRIVCQLIDTGILVESSICFPCAPKPTVDNLNGLCRETYPEKCTPRPPPSRWASDFLESCKRSCGGAAIKKTCDTLCEEHYNTRCKPSKAGGSSGCTAILMNAC